MGWKAITTDKPTLSPVFVDDGSETKILLICLFYFVFYETNLKFPISIYYLNIFKDKTEIKVEYNQLWIIEHFWTYLFISAFSLFFGSSSIKTK